MQLASITSRNPQLIEALVALSQRSDYQEDGEILLEELSGITELVAKKFTNDRTADGLLEAYYLTVGCISLGISQTDIPDSPEARLAFLLREGAEYVFQRGFRHIKVLSSLPYSTFVSDFDKDAYVQQRNLKALFSEICRTSPNSSWTGDEIFNTQLQERKNTHNIIECAKWLRRNHFAGPIKDSELDAHAVIAIAIIFAIIADDRIVARTGQKEIESLIKRARETKLDINVGWYNLLKKTPPEYQAILLERMGNIKDTIIKKITSKAKLNTVVTEIQDYYASAEVDIDYP